MPLNIAPRGKQLVVQQVNAEATVRRHLADLGIVAGSTIVAMGYNGGDMVVAVKDCRVALNSQLAKNIFVN